MLTLKVLGMTCDHCVAAIKRAVGALDHVESVEVDRQGGTVAVHGRPDPKAVSAAIAEEGYEVDDAG